MKITKNCYNLLIESVHNEPCSGKYDILIEIELSKLSRVCCHKTGNYLITKCAAYCFMYTSYISMKHLAFMFGTPGRASDQ